MSQNIQTTSNTPCRFFAQGKCNRGINCKWSHDASEVPTQLHHRLKYADTTSSKNPEPIYNATGIPGVNFQSRNKTRGHNNNQQVPLTTNPTTPPTIQHVPNVDHHVTRNIPQRSNRTHTANERARNERTTKWKGKTPIRNSASETPNKAPGISQAAQIDNGNARDVVGSTAGKPVEQPAFHERVLGGAMCVQFGPGLEIISISPITVSSSSIVIENAPIGTTIVQLQSLVQPFKQGISTNAIRTTPRGDSLRVVIHLDDTLAADEAVKALQGADFHGRQLSVKALKPNSTSQDVTKIECSWQTANATALLRLANKSKAVDLVDTCTTLHKTIRGQRVKAILQADRSRRSSMLMPSSVLLVNLPHDVTEAEIKRQFECMSATVREPQYTLSQTQTLEYIQHKLEINRPEDFQIISRPDESRIRAVVTFASHADATALYTKVNDGNCELLNKMNFTFCLTYSVNFNISPDIWKAVQGDIRRLEEQEKQKEKQLGGKQLYHRAPGKNQPKANDTKHAPGKVRIVQRGGNAAVSIYVNGCGRPAVAALKSAIQTLLKGKVVCDDEGKPIWDAALKGQEGKRLINLVMESGVHVHVDYRNQTVTLRGSPESIGPAEELLKEQYNLLLTMQHELSFDGHFAGQAMRGGIAAVQQYLGEDMVTISYTDRKILVRCSPAEIHYVRSLLFRPTKKPSRAVANTMNQEGEICPACYDTAEAPVIKTSCGHTYCKDCFLRFLKSNIDSRKFPLHCFHASDDGILCGIPLSLSLLQSTISKADAEQFFENAFLSYVQARPTEYMHCPTADCPTVYKITKTVAESFITCTQCFVGICTSCKSPSHHGQTCDDARVGEKEYQEWKRRAGVKSCPRCKADIEKNEGCNHISCNCGAHICWHCMRVFNTGGPEIYNHMATDCGGTYEPTLPQTNDTQHQQRVTGRQLNHHDMWLIQNEGNYLLLGQTRTQQRERETLILAQRRMVDEARQRRVREQAELARIEQLWRDQEAEIQRQRREREAIAQTRIREAMETRRREQEAAQNNSGGWCVIM